MGFINQLITGGHHPAEANPPFFGRRWRRSGRLVLGLADNPALELAAAELASLAQAAVGRCWKFMVATGFSAWKRYLVGGDWNMAFIFPYIGNHHPN